MAKNSSKNLPVSIIIPMKNSETTVLLTLKSISEQKYPIREIIVIDNVSSDNSVNLVSQYAKNSKIPVMLIKRRENKGVGASYNLGAKKAKAEILIFMHSDSILESKEELTKLVKPLSQDQSIVASFSTIINPESVWLTYNFWQKCLFARVVGKQGPGLNSKFDCLLRDVFLAIDGFDDVHFGENIGIGSEDADLHMRLLEKGKVVLSKAKVIHLHYLGKNYKLTDWIKSRKLLAKSYGSIVRIQGRSLPVGAIVFLIKPTLAIIPFIPGFFLLGIILLFMYTFWYTKKMFVSKSTVTDPRILLLPFINIFFVYYETYWMFESFFTVKRKPI